MRRFPAFFGCLLAFAMVPGSVVAAPADPPASTVLIAGTIGGRHAYGCGVIVDAAPATIAILTATHNLRIEAPTYYTTRGEHLAVLSTAPVAGHDLALVTARRPRGLFTAAAFGPAPAAGSRVRVWGPIADVPFTLHEGMVRAMDERVKDPPAESIALDCAQCDHGDSGTGVYDDAGRLVGIVTNGYFAGTVKLLVLAETYRPAAIAAAVPVP